MARCRGHVWPTNQLHGLSRRAAAVEAARAFAVPARVVYAAIEEAKKSVE